MKTFIKKIIVTLSALSLMISALPSMAYAETTSTVEDNNDTSSNATIITSSAAINGVLSTEDDVDFYKYTVDVAGYYNFTLTDTGAQGDQWRLAVYDSSLNELESDVNDGYTLTTNTYNFEKGTVLYIKVKNYYRAEEDAYSIKVNATEASDWEQEYTDTKDDATIINSSSIIHGNLYTEDDVDFYKYTVDVTGHYSFTLKDAKEQGGNWRLAVYDSSLNEIESEVNDGYTLTTNTYDFEEGTVLYLKVKNYYRSEHNEYTMSINATKASDWEQEVNDTKDHATVIKSNQTLFGNLFTSDDVDYYKYKVDVTGYFNFVFKDTQAKGGNWRINVYDSSLKELSSVVNDGNTLTTNTYNFKKGTILYIKVSDYYRSATNEYSLTVNAKKSKNWEVEKDDSYNKALQLKTNTAVNGNLYNTDDVDYYKYTAGKTGTIKTSFKFDANDVGSGWKVTIYDSAKKEVTSVSDITTEKTISFKAKKGKKYYVVVNPVSSYSCPANITYTLKIK